MSSKLIEPVIKWSGSKRSIAASLAQLIPQTQRVFEPFLGGGALLPFYSSEKVFTGDIISELIEFWRAIQQDPEGVSLGYEIRWKRLQNEGHTAYYEIREQFNQTRRPADLLFLSRTCVNGLIRFNKEGNFNNSLHHTRPGIHPLRLRKIILTWNRWIKNVDFQTADYRDTLRQVKKGDFVFLDPPYGGTRGRYLPQPFSLEDFIEELERLNKVGALWMLTFDGKAGTRTYSSQIPKHLYSTYLQIQTGNSPFTRLMGASLDAVHESVYLNFQPLTENNYSALQGVP